MASPTFRIHRATSCDGSLDPQSKFVFEPSIDSDELFDALRAAYPSIKTHSERKRKAVLDFLVREREDDLRALDALVSTEHQTPSTNAVPTPESTASISQPSPAPVELAPGAMFTNKPSTSAFQVWDPSSDKPVKLHSRRRMTDQEKEEYRMRRLLGSCDSCKQKRRKCRHFLQSSTPNKQKAKKARATKSSSSNTSPLFQVQSASESGSDSSPTESLGRSFTQDGSSTQSDSIFNESLFSMSDISFDQTFGIDFPLFSETVDADLLPLLDAPAFTNAPAYAPSPAIHGQFNYPNSDFSLNTQPMYDMNSTNWLSTPIDNTFDSFISQNSFSPDSLEGISPLGGEQRTQSTTHFHPITPESYDPALSFSSPESQYNSISRGIGLHTNVQSPRSEFNVLNSEQLYEGMIHNGPDRVLEYTSPTKAVRQSSGVSAPASSKSTQYLAGDTRPFADDSVVEISSSFTPTFSSPSSSSSPSCSSASLCGEALSSRPQTTTQSSRQPDSQAGPVVIRRTSSAERGSESPMQGSAYLDNLPTTLDVVPIPTVANATKIQQDIRLRIVDGNMGLSSFPAQNVPITSSGEGGSQGRVQAAQNTQEPAQTIRSFSSNAPSAAAATLSSSSSPSPLLLSTDSRFIERTISSSAMAGSLSGHAGVISPNVHRNAANVTSRQVVSTISNTAEPVIVSGVRNTTSIPGLETTLFQNTHLFSLQQQQQQQQRRSDTGIVATAVQTSVNESTSREITGSTTPITLLPSQDVSARVSTTNATGKKEQTATAVSDKVVSTSALSTAITLSSSPGEIQLAFNGPAWVAICLSVLLFAVYLTTVYTAVNPLRLLLQGRPGLLIGQAMMLSMATMHGDLLKTPGMY